MTSFKSGTFKTWVHNLYKNECTFMKGMPSSILLEGVPHQRSWGISSYSDSPSYGKEYQRSWRLSGPGFTFAERHTRWWHWGHQEAATHRGLSLGMWRLAESCGQKNDTFSCHVESEFLKTGKKPGFFKWFSTWVWKILFPDRKFDSHFTKSMGTWLDCISPTHKRAMSREGLFQSRPLQYKQNSILVFRHSCYTMLSNLVDFIFLRPLFASCSEAWLSCTLFPLTSDWGAGSHAYRRPEVVHGHCSLEI